MLPALVLLPVLLCSGSALGCSLSKRRFEAFLPLTAAAIMLLELLPGLAGFLRPGFYAAVLLCAAAWGVAGWRWASGRCEGFRSRLFDAPFFLFLAVYIFTVLVNYGKLLCSWDEFSHWGDVVKMMVTQDVLSLDARSRSLYPEYPPAMALLQYFVQRVMLGFTGGEMAEWPLYSAYQLFLFIPFFPLLEGESFRRPRVWLLLTGVFLLPTLFQISVYSKIYIDAFLGILFALALFWILFRRGEDRLWTAQLCALLLMLTLSKALGFGFALAAVWLLLLSRGKKAARLPFAMTLSAAGLWSLCAWLYQAHSGASLRSMQAAAAAHGAAYTAYHGEILRAYARALWTRPLSSTEAIVPAMPTLVVLALLLAGLTVLLYRERRRELRCLVVVHALFVLGLGAAFAYLFQESEARELLGLERYLNNLLLADGVLLFLGLARQRRSLRTAVLLLAVTLAFTPLRSTARFLTRREVLYSQRVREPFFERERQIRAAVPEGERVMLVMDDEALGAMALRTSLRPRIAEPGVPEQNEGFRYIAFLHPENHGQSPICEVGEDGSLHPVPIP